MSLAITPVRTRKSDVALKESMQHRFICLSWLILALPSLAQAEVSASGRVMDGRQFISLEGVRSGIPSAMMVAKNAPMAPVMRSDREAMRRGFMRIDRDLVVRHGQTANVVRATVRASGRSKFKTADAADVPRITRGSAVVDIFGDSGSDAPVFGQTLRGDLGRSKARQTKGHQWPIAAAVKQEISSGYGMRKDPFHGRPAFHGGVDIAAASGTPILASAAGQVAEVGKKGGWGNYVLLKHPDGAETRYSHLSSGTVREGQRVAQGQMIGRLGSTGRSTGPHLDYRIKKNGQRLDPMTVLRAPASVTPTKVAQVIRLR
ncbi:MAG: M23 family metallopeptidase [Alphaproteobacteria bacterium]